MSYAMFCRYIKKKLYNLLYHFIILSIFLFCTTINTANSEIVQENYILLDIWFDLKSDDHELIVLRY